MAILVPPKSPNIQWPILGHAWVSKQLISYEYKSFVCAN